MKILITGSSGMLGTELCEVLKEDYDIVGMDIVKLQAPDFKPRNFHEASITDLNQIKEIFDKERPELVIHTAAWTDVDGCENEPKKAYEVNTTGTRNVAEVSGKRGTPVVFISTDFVFDGENDTPYTEGDIGRPLNVYGKTKWEAEKILEQLLAHYVIVRTSWLYGQNGKNFVDTIVEEGKVEKRLQVVNDQIGSPTYAKDFAHALKELIRFLSDFKRDIFHVSNSGQCSWYDFALQILSEAKIEKNVIVEPITSSELTRSASRPKFSVLDNKKFQKATGYKMRPWKEALADYIRERYL